MVSTTDTESSANIFVIAPLTNPAIAWLRRHQRSERIHELRRLYHAHLSEASPVLGERIRFHLAHLDEYWARCLGFLEAARPVTASFLGGDWFLCILVASDVASGDIRAYCAQGDAPALNEAWEAYVASLTSARRGVPSIERGLRRAAADFARVRAVHASASASDGVG